MKSRSPHRLSLFFGLALLLLLIFQTNYLPFHPLPDSLMWWGDESWRMLSARDLLLTGRPVIAEAYGSTLSQNIGLVGASSWLTHLVYGIPIVLAGKGADIILIGRWISLLVGILTLGILWKLLKHLKFSTEWSLFGLLLFATTDAFLFASHSARPDMMTAFGVTFFLYAAIKVLERDESKNLQPSDLFWISVIWSAGPLLYIHVAPLTLLAFLYLLWKVKCWRSLSRLTAIVFGGLLGASLWLVPYLLLTKSTSLFGPTDGRTVQYNFVVMTMPLFHLLSPRVEEVNIYWRLIQWSVRARALMILLAIVGASFFVRRLRGIRTPILPKSHRKLLVLAALCVFSTFIVQGSAVFYMSHIMPALVLLGIIPWHGYQQSRIEVGGRPKNYLLRPNAIYASVIVLYAIATLAVEGSGSGSAAKEMRRGVTELSAASHRALPGLRHPRIFVDQGETAWLLQDTSIDLMTHHFLLFQITLSNLYPPIIDSVLAAQHVDFLMINNRESDLMSYARFHLPIEAMHTGVMHERNMNSEKVEIDTVFLFRAPKH